MRYRHIVGLAAAWLLVCLSIVASAGCASPLEADVAATAAEQPGDPAAGRLALQSYGCTACHVIPGVAGTQGLVGPPLTAWAERSYIAGTLPNEPVYLRQWIRYPQAIAPGTAMPNLNVTEADARHMSAYLYTLERNVSWYEDLLQTVGVTDERQ